jgi:hypothetical protein
MITFSQEVNHPRVGVQSIYGGTLPPAHTRGGRVQA